jgi:hypothetical protein
MHKGTGMHDAKTVRVPVPLTAESLNQSLDLSVWLKTTEPKRVREAERVWHWL